jgi:hypothetical protein
MTPHETLATLAAIEATLRDPTLTPAQMLARVAAIVAQAGGGRANS